MFSVNSPFNPSAGIISAKLLVTIRVSRSVSHFYGQTVLLVPCMPILDALAHLASQIQIITVPFKRNMIHLPEDVIALVLLGSLELHRLSPTGHKHKRLSILRKQ